MSVSVNTDVSGTRTARGVVPVALTDGASVVIDNNLSSKFTLSATQNFTLAATTNYASLPDMATMMIRIFGSGGARTPTLTVGSSGAFRFTTTYASITAVPSGKYNEVGFIWNQTDLRWDMAYENVGV